ncbi:MAG: hypothetical protein AAGG69_02100 [Pseudomonadota bacterium]
MKTAQNAQLGTIISSRGNPLTAVRRNAKGQRCVTIDKAVEWAFCHELPKSPPVERPMHLLTTSYGSVLDYAETGTLIDGGVNQWGVVADLSEDAFPHDDAIAIGQAARTLDRLSLSVSAHVPSERLSTDDLRGPVDRHVRKAFAMVMVDDGKSQSARVSPSSMLVHRAVIPFEADDGSLGEIALDVERQSDGRPRYFLQRTQTVETGRYLNGEPEVLSQAIEVDGWCRRRRIALNGSYTKQIVTPNPTFSIVARLEWLLWRDALRALAQELRGKLTDMDITPGLPECPWADDMPANLLLHRWWRVPHAMGNLKISS